MWRRKGDSAVVSGAVGVVSLVEPFSWLDLDVSNDSTLKQRKDSLTCD
jgi:hypothetical protein